MTKLKIHYDGWLVLPATIRRRMGVTTGDQLIAEWVDGGLLIKSPHGEAIEKAEIIESVETPEPAPKKPRATPKKPATSKIEKTSKIGASTIPKTRGRRKAAAT